MFLKAAAEEFAISYAVASLQMLWSQFKNARWAASFMHFASFNMKRLAAQLAQLLIDSFSNIQQVF